MRALGADEVIDYRAQRFDEILSGYHLVLDAIGGEARDRSLRILARGGHLSTLVGGFPEAAEKHGVAVGALRAVGQLASVTLRGALRGVTVYHVLRECNGVILEQITRRIERGAIRPRIDSVYPLEEIVEAHRQSERGHARGKIVIAVRS